jgi:hypothetical protein
MKTKLSFPLMITLLLITILSITTCAQFKLPQYEKFELETGPV